MEYLKEHWKRVPDKPRRILTFILGVLLIISAGLIGWLPGPGGTVLFLLGIAVLATEFVWAAKLRDRALALLSEAGNYLRQHRRLSTVLLLVVACMIVLSAYVFYSYIL